MDILDQTIVKGKRLRPSSEEDKDMANCLILLARGGSQETDAADTKPTPENTKFISRKSTEMSTAGDGVYVYECKTCSRTFQSFQALGGHRASHKKPKTTVFDAPPISAQLPNGILSNVDNKSRIHECSICGSEFASGQALGGHMRRHRPVTKIRDDVDSTSFQDEDNKRNMLALDFDLNLPAPPEDDHRRGMEFHDRFSPANQQRRLVFSAAALVDCHY